MQRVFDVDYGGHKRRGRDDVGVLPGQQPDLAAHPHAQHAQLIQHHDLGRGDGAGVDHLTDLALHEMKQGQWCEPLWYEPA